MGIPDSSIINLIDKVRSWISWGASDFIEMSGNGFKMCFECDAKFTESSRGFHCQNCGSWLCSKCLQVQGFESPAVVESDDGKKDRDNSWESVKSCKFCVGVNPRRQSGRILKYCEKVHPSVSPRESPEHPSHCSVYSESNHGDRLAHYREARDGGYSPQAVISRSMTSFNAYPSLVSTRLSPSRSDEEDAEASRKHFLGPFEYCQDVSDVDSSSISARNECYSLKSVGSSPSLSPSRNNFTPHRVEHCVQRRQGSPMAQNVGPFDQESTAILRRSEIRSEEQETADNYADDVSIFPNQNEKSRKPLDFENNGLLWYPPPPDDENDEMEDNLLLYDDEDDDVGDSGMVFSSSDSLSSMFPGKERQSECSKEPLKAVIQGHFRALVSQLLQGEGIKVEKEDNNVDWLDIVTSLAWQAANFVKPDTSKGGSMDPVDYVKVKCIASGIPSESALIKGVVCTKNIKHKRMTSQYKNPRLLLLGGALEFQKVQNQLASFKTLLQQENDHLKMITSKIEDLRPNVLLVEKSASSYVPQYLLYKEISLVLNVKRPLLERIASCTGAHISSSIDSISTSRLGHCELFRVEKISEEHEAANQSNRKPSKTLMFFEGCPRRLGCTVLLRGKAREELKKVKHVVQFAVFAAYHLSLETSFLADEGATLPKMQLKHSISEGITADTAIADVPSSVSPSVCEAIAYLSEQVELSLNLNTEHGEPELFSEHHDQDNGFSSTLGSRNSRVDNVLSDAYSDNLAPSGASTLYSLEQGKDLKDSSELPHDFKDILLPELEETIAQGERHVGEIHELTKSDMIHGDEISSEYFSATDTHQSILVSFSSRCVVKGTVCERSRLLRIKFYGCFDKPLGRYLRDYLFDQTSHCQSCQEPTEAHVICYTHQQGNLTINVRQLPSIKLPGEQDGKIWMWHRCLRCALVDGVPPATRRVVMSDAAWGLSFGKFLELSFSNHATANRVATCGHSLQRDCLRYYGFGSMVAFFRYSPIDIHSVHLPPSLLEFSGHFQQEWVRKEAAELIAKMETLFAEISDVLDNIEQKSNFLGCQSSDSSELLNHVLELKDQLKKERNDYNGLLQPVVMGTSQMGEAAMDILELNRLRRELLIGAHVWDHQLCSLDSLLKRGSFVKVSEVDSSYAQPKELRTDHSRDVKLEENVSISSESQEPPKNKIQLEQEEPRLLNSEYVVPDESNVGSGYQKKEDMHSDGQFTVSSTFSESIPPPISTLSERIDSAWTGTDPLQLKVQPVQAFQGDGLQIGSVRTISKIENPLVRRLAYPIRVHSFDSALRLKERIKKGLQASSLHLSTHRSFHASGDYSSMIRDPVSGELRSYFQALPLEAQKLNLLLSSTPTFISSASRIAEGARLLRASSDIVLAVYDNDPASVITYALSSKEYEEWVTDGIVENGGQWIADERNKEDSAASTFSAWQSFSSLDLDYGIYPSEEATSSMGSVFSDTKRSPHLTISFGDDSIVGGKVEFSVTCYFAKQFDSLRKKCCPSEVDFLRSLSRCQKWSAQGGKSNVYFAKSLDERFIIKQVKKTELESFVEFAPEYFKYLSSQSPTCLAKVLGIYQVYIKHLKSGKENKIDLMVMENLFFRRRISRIYDLKGSARSRYNPDTTGTDKVMLDMNLIETLRTEPIFLGSKAKRSLERAIWNDTSFLASVDVMDYSLLVGVDEERKELVVGIIDFVRQYTWDKQLETLFKASLGLGGPKNDSSLIPGGPKNDSPTVISPKEYKKRFRKAMTAYFLTIPDQWTS
ncbi:hypothetical protein SLEP1_g4219 [Rubroshorea leprosula]|uniref:1-phosphatidylinositol-3-phosphate 5-kinase n=3 Tax=Rubroshorea leprosula TaxID=152421 RepID=A0AAV5HYG6_9ROSI|nr:hypothetical protein SLEP1_g4219 [Rubroshorea leprosula]